MRRTTNGLIATVFGLGEAGSLIAADLAEAGAVVHGFDPAPVATPDRVVRHDDPQSSVETSSVVLSVTAAVDASEAINQALDAITPGTIYADLATASPEMKESLAETAASAGLSFVDVALMGTVPGSGLGTPALASGPGAIGYAEAINHLGGNVDVIGSRAGDAAARKLLRSVVTKGLTAVIVESLEAATERGEADWLWGHIVDFFETADEEMLKRLISGTSRHVERRVVEMEAARSFLEHTGVSFPMTAGTVEALLRIRSEGVRLDVDPDL